MTSEEILELLLEKAEKCYKRNLRFYCPVVARMLDRKETVEFNGIEYRCWQELVLHNTALLIQEYLPNTQCEVTLDMNNSQIVVGELTEEDEKVVMEKLKGMVINEK